MSVSKISKQYIEECLSNADGSLRDIRIGNLDKDDTTNFLKWYVRNYTILNAIDADGKNINDFLKVKLEDCHLRFNGEGKDDILIKDLNCFVDAMSRNTYEIELDFYPDKYSYDDFISFLKNILDCTKNREYYVMYENASWEYGDTSKNSGVIFSYEDSPI